MTARSSLKQEVKAPAGPQAAAPAQLVNLMVALWMSQAISVAAKLGIADLLAEGPRSCAELAEQASARSDTLYRLLRALASVGLFAEDEHGRFRLTPLAEYLRSDAPASLHPYALLFGQEWYWRACGDLLHSVRSGQSGFEHVMGMPLFDYLSRDPQAAAIFDAAMTGRSRFEDEAIAAAYDFPDGTIVDVGGGRGLLLATVLRHRPGAQGILFDLQHALTGAAELTGAADVAARWRLVAGDFFDAVPPGGDVYLMKKVIHDWDDDRAGAILANCREAMSGSGRLLVIEHVILPGNGQTFEKLFDLQMLAQTSGGRERSEAEFRRLLAAAGLRLARIVPTACPLSIVEALPA